MLFNGNIFRVPFGGCFNELGYEAGTRTAVEVLESRRQWIQARTDYARSRYDYMINVIKLQQAAGILSEQTLNRLNALLRDAPGAEAPGAAAPAAPAPGGDAPGAGAPGAEAVTP